TYRYDESGERSIERGPSGETASINPWVTVRNGTEIWKHFWAGNDRIGTQRDTGGTLETQQYFLHKDLQGNTNVVTDPLGNTFQHQEYFPTGEVWVAENSTVFRTPYQFGGGYTDEVRDLINFGNRWYDPIRELMYSPDPVLVDDLMAIVAEPSLRWAYAYAGSNAIGNIDPSGRQFTTAQAKAYINANMTDARRIVAADAQRQAQLVKAAPKYLPKGLVAMAVDIDKVERAQKKFDKIDDVAKPFVELNISTGDISLSPGLFKQFVVRKGNKAEPGVLTRKDPQPDIGAPPLQPSRKPPKPLPKPPIAGNEVAGDA
ncbi:MAG TPA: RHS repeat-associated core domain-containing protein, partial [Ilumatobacteraceae bacterium]|nr:RHS repeat-associated core domain-containing protein [Ilumatobacteraceae bacterium]